MKFTLIGLGSIGLRHLKNICELGIATQIYVFDQNLTLSEQLQNDPILSQHPIIFEHNFAQVIGHATDLALICTPNHLHFEHALPFVERGIPVFIEKPFVLDLQQGQLLLSKQTAPIWVAANMRYHPGVQLAKQALQKGQLGHVYAARGYFGHYLPNWRPSIDYKQTYSAQARQGGGILLDAIHDLDILCWFFGKVVSIQGQINNWGILDIDVEEGAYLVLKHESGVISNLQLDYLQVHKSRGLEIYGTQASYFWQSLGKTPEKLTIKCLRNQEIEVLLEQDYADYNQNYVDQLNEIIMYLNNQQKQNSLLSASEALLELETVQAFKSEVKFSIDKSKEYS